MKKIDEQKLRQYQTMNRAQDFLNAIEGGNTLENSSVNILKIGEALSFLRSLKDMNQFQILASEVATISAMAYLKETETFVVDCILRAEKKRNEVSAQLSKARDKSRELLNKEIMPAFEKIHDALSKVYAMPLPHNLRKDSTNGIKDDISREYRKISDMLGITYNR